MAQHGPVRDLGVAAGLSDVEVVRCIALQTMELGCSLDRNRVVEQLAGHGVPWRQLEDEADRWVGLIQDQLSMMRPGRPRGSHDNVLARWSEHAFTYRPPQRGVERWRMLLGQ